AGRFVVLSVPRCHHPGARADARRAGEPPAPRPLLAVEAAPRPPGRSPAGRAPGEMAVEARKVRGMRRSHPPRGVGQFASLVLLVATSTPTCIVLGAGRS